MTTIADLVARPGYLRRAHVTEPGFRNLYVRVRGGTFPAIVLADMNAHEPGSGSLTALLARLAAEHPDHAVVVENVYNERLGPYLERQGFRIDNYLIIGTDGEACRASWYRPAVAP